MTFFDGFALVIIGVSALAGFWRGGAKEIVSLFSFLLAGLISLLLLPVSGPIARTMMHPDWLATALAVIVVFVLVSIVLKLLANWLSRSLHENDHLGGADRMAGLAFGVLRAMVVLGVIHLLLYASTSAGRIPGWYRNAMVYPAGAASAKALQLVLPEGAKIADKVAPVVERRAREGASGSPQSGDRGPPPAERAREGMEKVAEATR